jgi:hypothetical protein
MVLSSLGYLGCIEGWNPIAKDLVLFLGKFLPLGLGLKFLVILLDLVENLLEFPLPLFSRALSLLSIWKVSGALSRDTVTQKTDS